MWNKDKSLQLSKFCVYLFMVIFAGLCVGAPWLFDRLITLRAAQLAGTQPFFLASTYTAAVPAALALWCLRLLLRNIGEEAVFVPENVSYLRTLSWCCIAAGGICFVSSLYYTPFLLIAAAAAFLGLILRVVKNVFAKAVEIKMENDYTI